MLRRAACKDSTLWMPCECRLRLALLSSIDRWSVLQVRLLCRRRLTIHHHNFGGTVIRSRTDPSPAARCEGKCMGVGTGGRVHLYPLLGLTQDEHASRIKPFTFETSSPRRRGVLMPCLVLPTYHCLAPDDGGPCNSQASGSGRSERSREEHRGFRRSGRSSMPHSRTV